MQRLTLLLLLLLLISTPAVSADLYAPPRVVERERIIERYYEPAPVYTERRVYVEEPEVYYEPRVHTYYDRPYGYAYSDWRPRHFFPRAHYWHRHYHHPYHHHRHRHW